MSLQKILSDISTELGIDITNTEQRNWIIEKVNDAALELYTSGDIRGCLREQTFNLDTDAQESSLVSLPSYIDEIRGCRITQLVGGKVPQHSMRPRYSLGEGWGDNMFSLPIRVVRESAMFKRDVSNASVLTFTLADVEEVDVEIFVVGATTNADKSTELVTIPAGQLSAETEYQYVEVPANIEKGAVTKHNITITDVDGNEMAVIGNTEYQPSYKWIEFQDNNASLGQISNFRYFTAFDILYKTRFVPFRNLFDEFPCPKCDRIIFYKFMQYYESQQPGKEQRAIFASEQCKKLLENLNKDSDQGKTLRIEFGRNGFAEAQNPYTPYKYAPYGGDF